MKKTIAAVLMGVGLTQVGHAEEWREPDYPLRGFYAGFDLGAWRVRVPGLPGELKGFTYSPFVGYQICRYFGVEAAYIGGSDATRTVDDVSFAMRSRVAEGSVVGTLPLTGYAGIYARAGVAKWWSTQTLTFAGTPLFPGLSMSADDHGTNAVYGAGVYQHFGSVAGRVEYTRTMIQSERVNRFTAAVYWRF